MIGYLFIILGLLIGIVLPQRLGIDDAAKRKRAVIICKVVAVILILIGGTLKLLR